MDFSYFYILLLVFCNDETNNRRRFFFNQSINNKNKGKQFKYKNEYENDPKVLKAPLNRSSFMFSLSRINIGLRMTDSY